MKRLLLFLAALGLLASWTAFGYYEGVLAGMKKVPRVIPVTVIDPESGKVVPLIGGAQLYCLDPSGEISACVNYEHTADGTKLLLVPKSLLEDDVPDQEPAPKAQPPDSTHSTDSPRAK